MLTEIPRDARLPFIAPTKFWTEYEENPSSPGEMIARDWVAWVKVGDRAGTTVQERVDRLQAKKGRAETPEWTVLKPKYEAWKRSEEIPVDGTPLAAWPGASPQLIEALKKINVRSMEDFTATTVEAFKGLPFPDLRGKQKAAKAFLEAAGDRSKIAAELESRDKQIASMQQQIADLKAGQKQAPKAA